MKRYILLFALAALQSLTMMADDGWHVYAAYHDARQTVFMHGKAYVLSDGSLFSYDPEDTSVETYTKANVMSDFGIFSILPCEKTNELIVIYTNGNIDIMDAKGNVFNMPDLKLKSLSDKTINDVLCEDGMLFICTSSGVVCFDMEKHLFGDFYSFENPVRTILVSDGFYYVATNKEILKGKIGDNLLDPARWSQVRTASWVLKLFKFNENIYCMQPSAIVRITNVEKFTVKAFLSSVKCNRWKVQDGRLFLQLTEGGVYELTGEEETVKIEGSDGIYDLTFGGGQAWAACGADGLKAYKLGDDHVLTETLSSVIPNSPQRNFSYRLSMAPNQRLLVAGGAFNYSGVTQAGTVMKYENGTWTTFDEENPVAEAGSSGYINVTDVVQDPLDSEHHWVSLARSGLYEIPMIIHPSKASSPTEPIPTTMSASPHSPSTARTTSGCATTRPSRFSASCARTAHGHPTTCLTLSISPPSTAPSSTAADGHGPTRDALHPHRRDVPSPDSSSSTPTAIQATLPASPTASSRPTPTRTAPVIPPISSTASLKTSTEPCGSATEPACS